MEKIPPKRAMRFLQWFCKEEHLEEIEGNLIELFEMEFDENPKRAKWQFIWQVLFHFRPDFIRSFDLFNIIHPGMLKHNLIITYRGFLRNKTSFLINLIGLSTGLACVLLIYLWVSDELKFDKFHENHQRIYQVMQNFDNPNNLATWEYSSGLLAEGMLEDFGEVEAATTTSNRYWHPRGKVSSKVDKHLAAEGFFGRKNFFDFFSFDLIEGNKEQVLNSPENIVLSESLAKNLFDSRENPIGKTVIWESEVFQDTFTVSGIFRDPPKNSSKQFDFVLPFEKLIAVDEHAGLWNGDYGETYLLLREGTDVEEFNHKIGPYLRSKSEHRDAFTLFVQRLSDRHLHGEYADGKIVGGRIIYVRLVTIIGFFIILIACINFMNLSTAKASVKMKEVGVKKTIGASRQALVGQFLGESIIMVFLSFILAILFAELLLPQFNDIAGKELQLSLSMEFGLALLGIILITGLLAGSYPAFYLSGFNPVTVLKGIRNTSFSEEWIRKGLVVFQFAISVIFIVSVIVVHQQIQFIQNKKLGYDRENILSFSRGPHSDDPQVFLSELKNIPGVTNASNMVWSILDGTDSQSGFNWSGQEEDRQFLFQSPRIGYDVIETLEMELMEGRSFSKDFNDDDSKLIINESALRMMQLEEPIGKNIAAGDDTEVIIGVVKDFHYGSIHKKVEPLIFRFRDDGREILAKIRGGTEQSTISQIEKLYKKFHPTTPFHFTFMDSDYQALYETESNMATLSKYFTILAIIISCLGLFGLATFTAERRAKEMGVRKILGSGSWGVVSLLTKDFAKMVLIAIILAIPVSFLISSSWLNNFAYKIELDSWIFILAAGIMLLIACVTVSLQTIKVARINPVELLKNE